MSSEKIRTPPGSPWRFSPRANLPCGASGATLTIPTVFFGFVTFSQKRAAVKLLHVWNVREDFVMRTSSNWELFE